MYSSGLLSRQQWGLCGKFVKKFNDQNRNVEFDPS